MLTLMEEKVLRIFIIISMRGTLFTRQRSLMKNLFLKKGGAAGFPVQFSRESESRKLNKEVQGETVISLSYRCKNKQEIKEFAKKYPEIYEFFNQVEEYEKCFEGFYTIDDRNLRSMIYQLVKDGGLPLIF